MSRTPTETEAQGLSARLATVVREMNAGFNDQEHNEELEALLEALAAYRIGAGLERSEGSSSPLSPENVPLGGAVCLLSCSPKFGIDRLSLRDGIPIGEEFDCQGNGSRTAVQISESEIVDLSKFGFPRVFDVMSGRKIASLGHGFCDSCGLAFLPRPQLLITGGWGDRDHEVAVWNRTTAPGGDGISGQGGRGTEDDRPYFANKCKLEGHTRGVRRLDAWEEEQTVVVSGSDDTTARVWDIGREECVGVLRGHRSGVFGLCHDSKRHIQFTGSDDKTVIAWDFRANLQKIFVQISLPNNVSSLCYRSKQSQLVVPCYQGHLRVIDIRMLLRSSDKPETSVVNEWDTGNSWIYDSCDVPDDNWSFFVTLGDVFVEAWKENEKCVWGREASMGDEQLHAGILPFLNGDPCCRFEQENDEKCAFMLEELGCFSVRIQVKKAWSGIGLCLNMWKWVRDPRRS